MPYDINILVVNQEKPSKIPFKSSIAYDLQVPKYDSWQYIYESRGIWYYLGKEENNLFNAASFCSSNFDIDEHQLPIPYWIKSEDVIYHLTPLVIKNEYKKEMRTILQFFINESPVKTLLFLARYQGGNQEIVQGVISFNDFFDLLESGKVLFNICYIIRE